MPKLTVAEARTLLKSDVGFSDEQLAAVTDAQAQKIAEGHMRQADYDRAMNEGKSDLDKAQADLRAANDRLNAEIAEWGQVRAGTKASTDKMQADYDKAQQDVLRLQQIVRRVASTAGLDPDKALADAGDIKIDPPKAPNLDGYVKADDLDSRINQQLGALASGMLDLTPELMQLGFEHQSLFGAPLDPRTVVAELKTRASTKGNQKSLNPREIWEELHGVPAKREETAKAKYDADLAAAREDGRRAALSEQAIPGGSTAPGTRAPIFGAERKSALQRPQPQQVVRDAAAAFRSGKYRSGDGGTKTA